MLPLAALVALALASAPAAAQAPAPAPAPAATPHSVSAVATPDRVRLGETFQLTIEVRDSSEVRYELPPGLSLGKEFDVVKVDTEREKRGGETLTRFRITAAAFDLGEKTLGEVVLSATGPQGAATLAVPGPKVTGVGDLKDDEQAQLHEILPPVEVLVPRYTLLWLAAATLLATLAALFLWRWLKNRPKRTRLVVAPPRPPAHERALAALDALQREDLPAQGRHKELHFRLSEILRDYLGERFGFLALDMTTEELLATLRRLPTPGLEYARFESWCQAGDLVKYAKFEPSGAACKQAIEDGVAFVRATLPTASAPPARPSSGAAAP